MYATHGACLEHDTGAHPERLERLVAIERELRRAAPDLPRATFVEASEEEVALAHTRDVVKAVRALAREGGGFVDPDTYVSPRSLDAALAAAGTVVGATRAVLAGTDRRAFCAVRPPGHHATASGSMGFCLFNSVAIAARVALREGASRVAIIDFDVHHGNGTQDVFWRDGAVFYGSLHRYPFYPGTGAADESGGGPGLGTTVNVPLGAATPPPLYHDALARVRDAAASFAPEILLVSAGFDAYHDDPIGGLGLDAGDFERIGSCLAGLADSSCHGRIVSVLEGGYHLGRLGSLVVAYLKGTGIV